jgi:hypothetical protein
MANWGMMSSSCTGVYAIDPLRDSRWPELIARHSNASVFHTRGWLGALATTYGYAPVAFTTSAPNEYLTNAVLFCAVRSWLTGSRLVSLPFSDHCEPLVECTDQFGTLCAHAEALRGREGRKYVEIRSSNHCLEFGKEFGRANTYALHRLDPSPMKQAAARCCSSNCTGCFSWHGRVTTCLPNRSNGFRIFWHVWERMSVSESPQKAADLLQAS